MFKKKLVALLGGAMALSLLAAQPVFAQSTQPSRTDATGATVPSETPSSGRLSRGRAAQDNQRQQRRQAGPTPEQNKAAAQTALTAAGINCQVTEANLLGVTAEQTSMYEAACATGPGFMVVNSTPPQTFNCLELASQAEANRARDPAAEVGQQCALPANQNAVAVTAAYARDAGIDCTVDQGGVIGRLEGNIVYEVGCAGADGYQIEQKSTGWSKSPCWLRAVDGATCRYSTPEEGRAGWKAVLSGTEASACDVQQARKVGADAQGLVVYEVKCAPDAGYFVRVNRETFTAALVHPCASAAHIGGGCTLSTVAPAATTSEQ